MWIVERMRYRPTNRPTDRPTDKASYRGALAHLKTRFMTTLSYLSRFVISSENGDSIWISNFEGDEQTHTLNRIVTTIHVIPCQMIPKLIFNGSWNYGSPPITDVSSRSLHVISLTRFSYMFCHFEALTLLNCS